MNKELDKNNQQPDELDTDKNLTDKNSNLSANSSDENQKIDLSNLANSKNKPLENTDTKTDILTEQSQPKPTTDDFNNNKRTSRGKIKISRETKSKLKVKVEKPKKVNKESLREYPVKLVKEISKIKWPKGNELRKKFIIVVIFMTVFALLFFGLDYVVNELFKAIKIL